MAKDKKKLVSIVTPVGVARFPRLTKPDTKFKKDGEYSVGLVLSPEEAAPLIKAIDAADDAWFQECLSEATTPKAKKALKRLHKPYADETDAEGEETGNIVFKASRPASFKKDDGTVLNFTVALFDSKGKPLPKSVDIWGGSKVKLNVELNPYNTQLAGVGVSLRLKAVQVIDLVSGGERTADAYGFAAVEGGYEAEEATGVAEEEDEDTGEEDENDEGPDF